MVRNLKPRKDPPKESGILIRNQSATSVNIVPIGTAPLECAPIRKKLSRRNTENTMPGTNNGVKMMLSFHCSPPSVLYIQLETKPPIQPKTVYRIIIAVARLPRLLGDKKPSIANTIQVVSCPVIHHIFVLMVVPAITNNCVPLPSITLRSSIRRGGRNTSPCTSFQPESSWTSSVIST